MKHEELNAVYGSNIKRLRKSKNLSQETLAEKADISPSFLSDIENGKKWGSFETLVALANALELNLTNYSCRYKQAFPTTQNAQKI